MSKEIVDRLKTTIVDLLEALDAPFPDSCDCGGSDMCAICNAYRTLKWLSSEQGDSADPKGHAPGCMSTVSFRSHDGMRCTGCNVLLGS